MNRNTAMDCNIPIGRIQRDNLPNDQSFIVFIQDSVFHEPYDDNSNVIKNILGERKH